MALKLLIFRFNLRKRIWIEGASEEKLQTITGWKADKLGFRPLRVEWARYSWTAL